MLFFILVAKREYLKSYLWSFLIICEFFHYDIHQEVATFKTHSSVIVLHFAAHPSCPKTAPTAPPPPSSFTQSNQRQWFGRMASWTGEKKDKDCKILCKQSQTTKFWSTTFSSQQRTQPSVLLSTQSETFQPDVKYVCHRLDRPPGWIISSALKKEMYNRNWQAWKDLKK